MDLKIKRLLPIGSIVLLNGSEQKVMVTGFFIAPKENPKKKIFEYIGCRWPQGVINSDENILFNSEDIHEIISKGPEVDEEEEFKKRLANKMANMPEIVEEEKVDASEKDSFEVLEDE